MMMLASIGRRVAHAIGLLLAVLVLDFFLIHLAPGDVAQVIAGEMGGVTEEILADIHAKYGLDKPFYQQALIYLGNVLRFDFGHSFFYNKPVLEIIWGRVPATLLLVITTLILSVLIGTVIGVAAARRPRAIDRDSRNRATSHLFGHRLRFPSALSSRGIEVLR